MTHITVESVMAERPCANYPQKRVAALFGDHTTVPLLSALRDERLSVNARLWLICHFMPRQPLLSWAHLIMDRAAPLAMNISHPKCYADWAFEWCNRRIRHNFSDLLCEDTIDRLHEEAVTHLMLDYIHIKVIGAAQELARLGPNCDETTLHNVAYTVSLCGHKVACAVRAPSGGWCAPTQKAHHRESELQIEQAIDILHDDANTDA